MKDNLLIPPQWLNTRDAASAAKVAGKSMVLAESREGGLWAFLRYLGVQPLSFDAVLAATQSEPLTEKGCAEIAAFSIRNAATGGNVKNVANAAIWNGTTGAKRSLTALAQEKATLTEAFVRQVVAAGATQDDLVRFVRIAVGDAANTLVPGAAGLTGGAPISDAEIAASAANATPAQSSLAAFDPLLEGVQAGTVLTSLQQPELETKFLPAWRGAEQYVAQILQSHGYAVEDRSRQNLGYDLYAEKDKRKYYIEVKLLDYSGQPFVITPNEESVARECGKNYALALTLRGKDGVHIQFVHDPVAQLKFVRQCRQWVWECSEYQFVPQFFGGNVQ